MPHMIAFRPKSPPTLLRLCERERGEKSTSIRPTAPAPEHDEQRSKATCTRECPLAPAKPFQSSPEADQEQHVVEEDQEQHVFEADQEQYIVEVGPEEDNWEPLANQPVWVTPSASSYDFFLSTQYSTFGHQQAMNNRINEEDLDVGGRFDTEEMHPMFLYDTLQLPGTLSYILGLESSSHIIPSMTPGTLRGFYTSVETATKLPLLWPARFEDDHVQGMVVFGRTQGERDILEQERFSAGFRIRRAEVEVRLSDGNIKVVVACFWVRDLADGENPGLAEDWTLDRFIAGTIMGFTPVRW